MIMNRLLGIVTVAATVVVVAASCGKTPKEEPIENVIERGLDRAVFQALRMSEALGNEEGRLPKSINGDSLVTSNCYWWCSGFFPGELWYLYEDTGSSELKRYAELFTERIEPVQYVTNNHDVGFMLYCSYGNGYRLTHNPEYRDVLLRGAKSLSSRFNPVIGATRSWNSNKDIWQFPVIIDNMMNLELLCWAGKENPSDSSLYKMAVSHANTTMKNHFRDDYSCFHVVSYDTLSGKPHAKVTHQGYADNSAWARGQAWALYGFTMMARETGDNRYLLQAERVADFLMNHKRMPEDKIPYWDYDDPDIPNVPRDASAAAIMASALLELSTLCGDEDVAAKYKDFAVRQIRSLSSPEYLSEEGENCNFLLKHSTGNKPKGTEVDVPLTYADYYYVEALLRLKKLLDGSL